MITKPRKVKQTRRDKTINFLSYNKKLLTGLVLVSISLIVLFFILSKDTFVLSRNFIKVKTPNLEVIPIKTIPASLNLPVIAKLKLPVILYHYVEVITDPAFESRKKLTVNIISFESELQTLNKENYQTYFVRDIPAILEGKVAYNPKNVFLTFDDGYEDFYTDVFPLLKKYNVKGTLYVVNNFINKNGYLTEGQIKEIITSNLVEIGAHTLDHIALSNASSSSTRKQIFDSKTLLEERFGIGIQTFAYPYGTFNQAVANLVKDAGYSSAVSVVNGSLQSKDNLFYLNRIRAGFFSGTTIVKILENLKS